MAIDEQFILNEFENAVIENDGALTSFTGYKTINESMFEEFDNINAEYINDYVGCRVKYDFSYDSETNIVVICAKMENELGDIYIDNIQGVCFINDNGDIDAVLNIDGEGILLSEMRDAEMIQNCGWFTKLVKNVAVATAVVTTTVAVSALIVATAGAAAPVVIGVGVAAASTVSTALTIASTSLVIAAISSGIALTVDIINQSYPGIKATTTTVGNERVITVPYNNSRTKEAIRDITIANTTANPTNPEIYFRVTNYNYNGPTKVSLEPYTKSTMANNMKLYSWSSITAARDNAYSVIATAFPKYSIVHDAVGVSHYHAVNTNNSHLKGQDGKYIVHSFYLG